MGIVVKTRWKWWGLKAVKQADAMMKNSVFLGSMAVRQAVLGTHTLTKLKGG